MIIISNSYLKNELQEKEAIMDKFFTKKESRFSLTHPLKKEFRKRKIPLWCLRNVTGVSEPKLSRYLNNIDRMPIDLEMELQRLLDILNGDLSSLGVDQSNDSNKTAPNVEEGNKIIKGGIS